MRLLGIIFYILLGCTVLPFSIRASTLLQTDSSEAARQAGWIARVRVESVEAANSQAVLSRVVGSVREIFKGSGSVGDRVQFVIPGGETAKKRLVVMGMPAFRRHQDYIVFLEAAPQSANSQQALSYGTPSVGLQNWTAFRVVTSALTNQQFVVRNGSLVLANRNQRTGALSLSHAPVAAESYEEFVTKLYRDLD